ncbi:uncharacterized protein LOC113232363 isoform X2 [Hyposmocoma kahamanoa]|uniref:uncharacterized protein LOC113232363 isoform X2 n=1 Tax=Hyposmocoma kahamanoa TaxID=1477025 RepID=UPI000E6D916D|nr:uncharacterized protein LOC113232363 isoform X2 [Hyposmocoma kahamanoa]
MALVLRNAILPRNIFSLKYFKNRSITTMMQKRKPVLLPMAISHRPMAMAIPKRYMKTGEVKRLLSVRHRDCQQKTSLRYSSLGEQVKTTGASPHDTIICFLYVWRTLDSNQRVQNAD